MLIQTDLATIRRFRDYMRECGFEFLYMEEVPDALPSIKEMIFLAWMRQDPKYIFDNIAFSRSLSDGINFLLQYNMVVYASHIWQCPCGSCGPSYYLDILIAYNDYSFELELVQKELQALSGK